MQRFNIIQLCLVVLIFNDKTTSISLNQPKFSPCATWDANGTTFANSSSVGDNPFSVFVNSNNTVYVNAQFIYSIQIWLEGSLIPTMSLNGSSNDSYSMFVTLNGDIYVDNRIDQRIEKWPFNTITPVPTINITYSCRGIFVDDNNTLYFSIWDLHEVRKLPLNNVSSNPTVIAGTGSLGSASNELFSPYGIFVDNNFTLYVADCGNNRVQRFLAGELNGTTVAGNGSNGTIELLCPTDVVLDSDGNIFIVDGDNHRIIGSGPYGFICIAGCAGVRGSGPDYLSDPWTMSFDSYGNIFVADGSNNRIQKFILTSNSCNETTISIDSTTSEPLTTFLTTDILSTLPNETAISIENTTSEPSTTFLTTDILSTLPNETISNLLETSSITYSILRMNQSCFSPVIQLYPNTTSFLSPMEILRTQYVYINSYLELNCNDSLSITTKWTIYNCTLNCLSQIELDQTISTTDSEIFLPAKTLPYGFYELKLTATMVVLPYLMSTSSVFIKVRPSDINVNLIPFSTSKVTHGQQEDLFLNPGNYSIDPNGYALNANDWIYEYYCRIYGQYDFPQIQGVYLTIDDNRTDPSNPSCVSNKTLCQYQNSLKSSMVIRGNALESNRTYQFMTYMISRQNSSTRSLGYLLVQIQNTQTPLVIINCVIEGQCISKAQFQRVNPTTQIALFSDCIGNCSTIISVAWNIYQGYNTSSLSIQWILFNQTNLYENIWIFGRDTIYFTVSEKFLRNNSNVIYWRFEVIYTFSLNEISSSAIDFAINQSPRNGQCSINPLNGTINTLFTISCLNWFDEDGIKDYSVYIYKTDISKKSMVAFSSMSTFDIRLPGYGYNNTSMVNLIVFVRDMFDCVTEFNLNSIPITINQSEIYDLVNNLKENLTNIQILQLLSSKNQNTIAQTITSISQGLNEINNEIVNQATLYGIPVTSISISPIGSSSSQQSFQSSNISALNEYNQRINTFAYARDYIINFMDNLPVHTASNIQLQGSAFAQITQATNQLTRTASAIASRRCHQLAQALYSMSYSISYEDVQNAASQILQCSSNAFSSIYGPIQERTSILNLDFIRANKFPDDYDTNLEFPWSNPNLFADGDDFSSNTIEKGRNRYYQRETADIISRLSFETIQLLTNSLNIHINIGQNFTINTSSVLMSLETISVESLSNKSIENLSNAKVYIPSNFQLYSTSNVSISLRSVIEPLASGSKSQYTNLSRSLSFSMFDKNDKPINIKTNFNDPIEIIIPRDPNIILRNMSFENVTSLNLTRHNQLFNNYYVNLKFDLTISVHLEMKPLNTNLSYLLIYKFDNLPQLNSSINQIDGWFLFCPSQLINNSMYAYFIDNQHTNGHEFLVFGLRELNSTVSCFNRSNSTPPIFNEPFQFSSDYYLRIYTSGCYYLDINNTWQSDGLVVGSLTNHFQTQCFSTHLTTFAGGYFVLPKPINWNYVFASSDFNKNKTIYITVICVSTIYFILMIYARYKDKKDLEKLGVTPLIDNNRNDKYFYQIIIFTGHRKDAGTMSKVHFILAGTDDETRVRTLSDSHRQILQRGAVDLFVIAVPKSLGLLNYIRIWHDNSGKGSSASWFLKYIIVQNLQTMEKSYFICQKWLAVEKDDGLIERTLPVASETEQHEFAYILSKEAYQSLSDGHLWFSIFSRPPSNKFTRVQRCTSCFVLLFLSMFFNILYYDQSNEARSKPSAISLTVGTVYITIEQVYVGFIVEFLSFIPSLLLVQLFQRIRPRIQKSVYQLNQSNKLTKKRSITFPWWFLFIAYGLSLVLIGTSIFFIIARGIEFGDEKTQKWLISLISGFLSSILIIQPMKILFVVLFFAFFIRKFNNDDDINDGIEIDRLNENEDYLHLNEEQHSAIHRKNKISINRLTQYEIEDARNLRLKEIKMWSRIREISSYFIFLSLLYSIIYLSSSTNGYFQVNHLKKYLLNTRQHDIDLTKALTINQYWHWLESSFVENIRAQKWYNSFPPRHLNGYMNDKANRFIGWPIMRQSRVKLNSCQIPNSFRNIITHCNDDLNIFNEEKRTFQVGWQLNQTINPNVSSAIRQAFQYQVDGYVYEFRGSLVDIRSNVSQLHRFNWIDNQTREIALKLSLYNPNSELFVSINILTQVISTGGLLTKSHIEPISFQVFTSLSQLICSIIYMVFIIYIMITEIQLLIKLKMKYLTRFWSIINFGIVTCSWAILAVYILRLREFQRIGNLFKTTNGYVYIDLDLAVHINNILIILFGVTCFLSTLKFVRLCRFNSRLLFFIDTLRYATKDLLSFACMFAIVFIAFVILFYLLFSSKMAYCSTLFSTAQMLFEMTLMKFDAHELTDAASFLGPFCFSLFIIIVVFVCMNMFLSIINDKFRLVREINKRNPNNDELFQFIFRRFQKWSGWKKQNSDEICLQRDEQIRCKYIDSVEHFPNKIDELVIALNRLYNKSDSM